MTLRQKCIDKGYTFTRLSKESGVSITYLSRLNTGKYNNPTLDILEKIAKVLCVTIDEIKESLKN